MQWHLINSLANSLTQWRIRSSRYWLRSWVSVCIVAGAIFVGRQWVVVSYLQLNILPIDHLSHPTMAVRRENSRSLYPKEGVEGGIASWKFSSVRSGSRAKHRAMCSATDIERWSVRKHAPADKWTQNHDLDYGSRHGLHANGEHPYAYQCGIV